VNIPFEQPHHDEIYQTHDYEVQSVDNSVLLNNLTTAQSGDLVWF